MIVDFDIVRSESIGKWLSIWRSLGIDIDETGKHGKCPSCGGKDRFRVDKNVSEKGSYYCNGCGPGFGFDLVMKVLGVDIKEAMGSVARIVGSCEYNPPAREKKISPEVLRKIFVESKPIQEGDVAYNYLKKRGLKEIPKVLRHTSKCWNPDTRKEEHALLAVFTLPDNTAITMQRIFLTPDGDKLNVENPKKHLPALRKMNSGAVRLWPVKDGVLGIAEGIETAIAASEDLNIPVWASLSSTLMEAFEPTKDVKMLVVFADNDANYTGQKAAFSLANKISITRKIPVTVYVPDVPGQDWLDVVSSKRTITI